MVTSIIDLVSPKILVVGIMNKKIIIIHRSCWYCIFCSNSDESPRNRL